MSGAAARNNARRSHRSWEMCADTDEGLCQPIALRHSESYVASAVSAPSHLQHFNRTRLYPVCLARSDTDCPGDETA